MFRPKGVSKERIAYTLSQATSQFCTIADDFKKMGLAGYVAGGIGAIIEGLKSYFFQGKSIDQGKFGVHHHHHRHVMGGRDSRINSNSSVQRNIRIDSNNDSTNPLLVPHINVVESKKISKKWQYLVEGGLNTTTIVFILANRYFLVTNLLRFFGFSPMTTVIWPIIISDTACAALFQLTNELYETNAELAGMLSKGVEKKPVYAEWYIFRKISGSRYARDFIVIVGTLEHSIVEDILPWLLFVPTKTWEYLYTGYKIHRSASVISRILAVFVPLIGSVLALAIIFQTILFESEHSYIAYRDISGKTDKQIVSLFGRMRLPLCVKKFISYTMYLMPPCHGAATAVAPYIYVRSLFGLSKPGLFASNNLLSIIKSVGVILVTLFTFIGTGLGHYHSEFKEAKIKLGKLC